MMAGLMSGIEAVGQSLPTNQSTNAGNVRQMEAKIEGTPGFKSVKVFLTNLAVEDRYLLVPYDLMPYRIKLTTAEGRELTLTPKGKKEFTPSGGSMRMTVLERGKMWCETINLVSLFEFPESGEVRCEVARHVFFTHPDVKPSDKEWISFPPIMLPSGLPASPLSPSARKP